MSASCTLSDGSQLRLPVEFHTLLVKLVFILPGYEDPPRPVWQLQSPRLPRTQTCDAAENYFTERVLGRI